MKSKEEILKHLHSVGYTDKAVAKIMGFLIGSGMKEENEKISYRKGFNEWEAFWGWYSLEKETFCAVSLVDSLIDDVMSNCYDDKNAMFTKKLDFLYDLRKELLSDDND